MTIKEIIADLKLKVVSMTDFIHDAEKYNADGRSLSEARSAKLDRAMVKKAIRLLERTRLAMEAT